MHIYLLFIGYLTLKESKQILKKPYVDTYFVWFLDKVFILINVFGNDNPNSIERDNSLCFPNCCVYVKGCLGETWDFWS